MTLALYGKSRKRQGSLLLAALLSILAAAAGSLLFIGSAFAHHPQYDAQRYCTGNWRAEADYVGGGSQKLLVFTNLRVNGEDYATSWSSGYNGTLAAFISSPGGFPFKDGSQAGADYYWLGTDSGFSIFDRDQTDGVFVGGAANWGGTVQQYSLQGTGSQKGWYRDTGAQNGGKITVTEPASATDCAKIIIKKVVSGPGSNPADNFVALVNNEDGSSGEASGLNFSQNAPYTHIWDEGDDWQDDFNVTETNANSNGYEVVGTWVSAGDKTCPAVPASGTSGWTTSTPGNADGLDNIANGDTYTVCFWNRKVAQPSVTVTKTAPQDSYALGDSFDWTITATVANGPTTANYAIWDDVPAQFTVNSITETDASVSCAAAPLDPVSCTLASGAANGAHTIKVNVTVKAAATCGPVTNNVHNGTSGAAPVVASDTVTITGCGSVTIDKSDSQEIVGNDVIWTITLHNSSALAKAAIVYDPNTTLVASGTVGCAANITDDYYDCTVPAGGQATLKLSRPIPAHNICTGIEDTNTAYIAASNTSGSVENLGSDSGKIVIPAQADISCLSASKSGGTLNVAGDLVEWVITIKNTGPAATVAMSDTYQPGTTGTSITSISGGLICSVASATQRDCTVTVGANSQVDLTLTTTRPEAQCGPQTVINNLTVLFNGQHVSGSPDNNNTYIEPANTELCNKQIKIVKNFVNLNGYVPTASDIPTFTLNPSEGTSCAAPVLNGAQATVTCTVPSNWDGTVTETPKPGWTKVECVSRTALEKLQAVVEAVVTQEYLPTYVFCNEPRGTITVIKQDNVSGDNPARPADGDWDFTVTGPNGYSQSGTTAVGVNPGQFVLTNVPLGNGYDASELDGVFGECPVDSNPNGDGYQTTELTPGAQNLATPGGNITFIFRNDDCGVVLGSGVLRVVKVRDINGDGVVNGADSYINWTVTVTGPEFPGGQQFNVPNDANGLVLAGLTEGSYTVVEAVSGAYAVVGVRTDENPLLAVSNTAVVELKNNDEDVVTFYNQPLREIRVVKTAVTRHGNGPDVAAPNDDDGWLITVSSDECKYEDTKATDVNGVAVFTNLPACDDYVVSENPVNAGSPGFTPASAPSVSGVEAGLPGTPAVVNFVNRKQTYDPPCANCNSQTPTATPTTPPTSTPVPPTSTPVPPTNTVVPPVKTEVPATPSVSIVQGERTPIAPSTGAGGLMGGAGSGMNLVLIIGGLLALTSGLSFVALGRKRTNQ